MIVGDVIYTIVDVLSKFLIIFKRMFKRGYKSVLYLRNNDTYFQDVFKTFITYKRCQKVGESTVHFLRIAFVLFFIKILAYFTNRTWTGPGPLEKPDPGL